MPDVHVRDSVLLHFHSLITQAFYKCSEGRWQHETNRGDLSRQICRAIATPRQRFIYTSFQVFENLSHNF